MYKADGTKIKNPSAYVASIERNGYEHPLFTADGEEIRNPTAYLAKKLGQPVNQAAPRQAASRSAAPLALFKEDGTPIKNPEAYVASIEKNGYVHPLFNADGEEIRNPKKYLEANSRSGIATVPVARPSSARPKPSVGRRAASSRSLVTVSKKRVAPSRLEGRSRAAPSRPSQALPREAGLYKGDGSKIKNPAAYVANFKERGQSQPLFTATGEVVNNPEAYVMKMMKAEGRDERRAAGSQVSYYGPAGGRAGKLGEGLFAKRLRASLANGMRLRAAQVTSSASRGLATGGPRVPLRVKPSRRR